MSGTIKLIGSEDAHWDDLNELEDHAVETRLIGKEDIYWDSDGTGEQSSFVDRTGVERVSTLINASHVPLPKTAREALGGASNVSEGLVKLSKMTGSGASGGSCLSEDADITLESSLLFEEKQHLIEEQPHNLGGKTLTFLFPEALDLYFTDPLEFSGFYNGTLIVDLQGITISDGIDIGCLLRIANCQCKVEIKNGILRHTLSLYAIEAQWSKCVYLTDLTFIGSGGTENYAFHGYSSDGYSSGCTFSQDNQVKLEGFLSEDSQAKATGEANSKVGVHNSAGNAHQNLFNGKAALNHTHTAEQANADPAGTANTKVNTHNSANDAHQGILAPLASPTFTGAPKAPTAAVTDNSTKLATTEFVQRAISQTAGIADTNVATHNASGNAHSGVLAPLASPTFTGTPAVPTAATGTNTTQAASTAFVKNAISSSLTTSGSGTIKGTIDSFISTHNSASNAHQSLFNGKANTRHGHTPTEVGADPAGTANTKVSTHNSANDAHETLLDKLIPPGVVFPYAGAGTVPSKFLLCNGRAVSRTTYSKLFAAIGTTYGSGDGSTTFNIPDFRGVFLRGYKSGTSEAIGQKQGEGLPNILSNGYIATEYKNSLGSKSALYALPDSISNSRCGDQHHSGPAVAFDASKSNSIYGASNHVTPENCAVQYIIKY